MPENEPAADPAVAAVPDGLVQVVMARTCNFRHQDGTMETLHPGLHRLPPKMANHWFIVAHTDKPQQRSVIPGTPQWADVQRRARARQQLLDAAAEQMAEDARQEGVKAGRDNTAAELAKDEAAKKAPPTKRAS